jgi:hypothetical protein
MTPNKLEAEPASAKPTNTKAPDLASASVPDTLATLKVNLDIGLAHADVDIRRKENGSFVGLPGLTPLPRWQMLAIFIYAMVSCLVVNDVVKVVMIKRLVPMAVA